MQSGEAHHGRTIGRYGVFLSVIILAAGSRAPAQNLLSPGLAPENVLVVYNQTSCDSGVIARYYARVRNVQANHLCPIAVNPDVYALTLQEFRRQVRRPIDDHIEREGLKDKIRCLLLTGDIPLGVNKGSPDRPDFLCLDSALSDPSAAMRSPDVNPYQQLGHPVNRFQPVPFTAQVQSAAGGMMLVSRVDGPYLLAIKRMLDSARQAEESARTGKPFRGTFYIDLHQHSRPGANAYNAVLERCGENGKRLGDAVVIERTAERLKSFDAGPAVFYAGWYTLDTSLNRGQTNWAPGAVAVEINSASARNLRSFDNPDDMQNSYVAFFIAQGVAGTYGAFREPTLGGFARPDEVLIALGSGLTWAESYWSVIPNRNWQMVLLGDPLYRPFTGVQP